MNKLGEKIKEIRIKEGLSQDAFAKELGYNSRSTINKIEKGINDISYDKLLLLMQKYELGIDELFDKNYNETFEPSDKDSVFYLSFSARNGGNCEDIANLLKEEKDQVILFKDILYNPCSKCKYECFQSVCKYRYDDIYYLIDSMLKYKKIVYIVPMYCGNPSSLYFILNERMQDYFNHNQEKWSEFIDKMNVIGVYGSDEETPYFINHFEGIVQNEHHLLKIERHKYNLKMDDKVTENKELAEVLNQFKRNIM